jgi:hypothetical protein
LPAQAAKKPRGGGVRKPPYRIPLMLHKVSRSGLPHGIPRNKRQRRISVKTILEESLVFCIEYTYRIEIGL